MNVIPVVCELQYGMLLPDERVITHPEGSFARWAPSGGSTPLVPIRGVPE